LFTVDGTVDASTVSTVSTVVFQYVGKPMEELKEYHNIVQKIWKLFKASVPIVQDITDPYDPKWLRIVADFETVYKDAPREIKPYANDMMLVHVKALEDMWRWKK
jgi:hypothetical protein